jgi:hypothetical protein
MKRICVFVAAALILSTAQLLGPVHACSLCNGSIQRDTLGMEFERAPLVLYGQIANARLSTQPGAAPGTGSTDFHVEKVLKDTTGRGPWKDLVLPRYLPVLDAKNPPRMLFFCEFAKDKLDPYHGRAASPAMLEYLQATLPLRAKDRTAALVKYSQYLAHPDQAIADDAFLEFAKSNDRDVGHASKQLDAELIRRLVRDTRSDPDRLSVYAFLLGGCGNDQDARYLRSLLDPPNPQLARALDGVLAGYIQLQPKDGWDLTYKILADRKQQFGVRFAVARTLRFYHGWQPKESRDPVLYAMSLMIPDGDVADLAIEDLRQWQTWDLTKSILAQYGKSSHGAPIIKNSIVRYALCCPQPEARAFVESVRRRDPETVRDLEEFVQFERKK